ncbi:hypothetical protein EB796_001257 [Bugula neritina]|uniref:Uncharacterized protein n=1 Tax=Bugula neritina TaxID=10212 RepID=A0A7J7KQR9_BUGNE|nr:hypothetical protein EB796_001257 [Bugula neritina]
MQTQDNSGAPSEDTSDAPSCDEPRKSTRTHRPPVRFGIDEYISNSSVAAETSDRACFAQGIVEPKSYAEALTSPQLREWLAAAQADSLVENNTWELVPLPSNCQTLMRYDLVCAQFNRVSQSGRSYSAKNQPVF